MARGVGKVLDPAGAGAELDWAAGIPYYWYDSTESVWKLQPGAPDPAQVINYSRGSDSAADDSLTSQVMDATVNDYGISVTVAAGNSGPAPQTINDPALAYNVIGVGAFSGGGTTTPSDDTVFGWSSRGPTVAGRKKPDIVAVGDGGLADSYYQTTGQLWKYDTGTSYSAPQVGAGAILLAGAGIRDPKLVKAILVDSARLGRVDSASAMGTQTGWQPDWGWGELNLDAAYRERYNYARADVPPDNARFFRATAQAPGDRATLVWNRRIADCQPLRQGCYYDTDSGFRVHTLSNLDLTEYDAATGAQRGSSASTVDNVEQVRAPAAGSVVYKVSAGAIDGLEGEPFALAATRAVTPLATPQPTTSIHLSNPGLARAGEPVAVSADIANPSADLSAEDAHVTLNLPTGVELVSGTPTQALGTLQPNGSPDSTATASWVVRGSASGVKQLIASTTASRFGSTFRSSAAAAFTVDADAPGVTLAAPRGAVTNPAIPLSWGATDDGAGVRDFDVEVAANGSPFTPFLTATAQTGAVFPGAAGNLYRFRARATDNFGTTSGWVASDEVAVAPADQAHSTPPPRPTPPPVKKRSPGLKIAAVTRRGTRLTISGSLARGAVGKVRATLVVRSRTSHTAAKARRGRFRLALRMPRGTSRAKLLVAYAGDATFAPQTVRTTVRSR